MTKNNVPPNDRLRSSSSDVFLTPGEVAVELQVTQRTVHNWLRKGVLTGQKFGGVWRVKRSALSPQTKSNSFH